MRSITRRMAGVTAAATLAIGIVTPFPAAAADPTTGSSAGASAARPGPARLGLYGAQDPTYDGVYRQGLAILALHDADASIDPLAVEWLLRQQCTNGRFMSWRTQLGKPCGPADSNATSMAVMALEAVGRHQAADRGAAWLVRNQARGGGWRYTKGWPADANSTGLAIQALLAVGIKPLTVSRRGTGFDFLARVQLGCDAVSTDRGALDYQVQTPQVANAFATAQSAQALARTVLPVTPNVGTDELPELTCDDGRSAVQPSPKALAAGYLGRLLQANDGLIPPSFGTDPDYGSTANAVLSLIASGYGAQQVTAATTALEAAARSYVFDGAEQVLPAAAGLMVLAEQASGDDPRDVDGVNLVLQLRRSITR